MLDLDCAFGGEGDVRVCSPTPVARRESAQTNYHHLGGVQATSAATLHRFTDLACERVLHRCCGHGLVGLWVGSGLGT